MNNYMAKMGSLLTGVQHNGVSFYRKKDAIKYIKKMGVKSMLFESKTMTGKPHTWTVVPIRE